jgi:hypothetical protein
MESATVPRPGDRHPGFVVEVGKCWALVYDGTLQADHCAEPPNWTGRWHSPSATDGGGPGAAATISPASPAAVSSVGGGRSRRPSDSLNQPTRSGLLWGGGSGGPWGDWRVGGQTPLSPSFLERYSHSSQRLINSCGGSESSAGGDRSRRGHPSSGDHRNLSSPRGDPAKEDRRNEWRSGWRLLLFILATIRRQASFRVQLEVQDSGDGA